MNLTHFIDIDDHPSDWLAQLLALAHDLRRTRANDGFNEPILSGKTLAMIFEKPSLRTRVSFEQAMYELGGHAIVLSDAEVGLGKRESIADVARVLSGMVDGVMARVFEHEKLTELAAHASVPVINALSDRSHPCQALADVMTLQDEFGEDASDRKIAFVGDGNNVALSLARLCAKLGIGFVCASPDGYAIAEADLASIRASDPEADVTQVTDPKEAVAEADAIYADTFVSMGQESDKDARIAEFAGYQINAGLLAAAPDHAIVLHCLPAYRDIEITADVIDGPRSRVFAQAHNRLHAQKALLATVMAD